MATAAYLAAVYLAADAVRHGDASWAKRSAPVRWSPGCSPARVAIAGLAVLHADARPLYDGLTTAAGWRR